MTETVGAQGRHAELLAGRYRLGAGLGAGATARVFEAFDVVLEREAAVKVFRAPDLGAAFDEFGGAGGPGDPGDPGGHVDPDAVGRAERFDHEVRMLGSLIHPHLLPLYDAGNDGDRWFIVMPIVRGTDLAKILGEGPMEATEVRRVGRALAEALAYVHSAGIVHRDVKPSNILLATDGTPYLADFGFAHSCDGPALTATNCVVGTAGYLAPERLEGRAAGPASDVYGLGLVLLEALTGRRTYTGTPAERVMGNALRPPEIPAGLGPGWYEALTAMTAQDPQQRPSAEQVAISMETVETRPYRLLASSSTTPIAPPVPSRIVEPKVRPALVAGVGFRRAGVSVAALVAVVGAGFAAETWWPAFDAAGSGSRSPAAVLPGNGPTTSPTSSVNTSDPTTPSAVAVTPGATSVVPVYVTIPVTIPVTGPASASPAASGPASTAAPAGPNAPAAPATCQKAGGNPGTDKGHGKDKCHPHPGG